MVVARELRQTFRRLMRRPISAAGIVLTLTLGIGISVGMFSVLHAVVLRALPYPDAERIVTIYRENLEQGVPRSPLTPAEAKEVLADVPGFEQTAYYYFGGGPVTFTGGDTPRNVRSVYVSADYFSVFSMPAALGRTLTNTDITENRPAVVLSHEAWMELTGGDPAAIGRTLAFQEGTFELVGVLPEAFSHPFAGSVMYRPMFPIIFNDATAAGYLNAPYLLAIGRLETGVSPAFAANGLAARLAAVNESYNLPDRRWRLGHAPLINDLVGDVRGVLFALFAVTLLVVLVACATSASLVSIRLERRAAELAIRRALGADRGRIATSVALEVLLLATLAALGGVLLARLLVEALQPLAVDSLPRADAITIDGATLLYAAAASAGSALLSGVAPLSRALRGDPIGRMRGRTPREVEGGRRIALLPAAGIGLSTIALVTALALTTSLIRLGDVDLGFRTNDIAGLQIFRSAADAPRFAERAFEELRAVPGVRGVAAVSSPPLLPGGNFTTNAAVPERSQESVPAIVRSALGGYHRFLGIPLLRGRDISERDSADAPRVAVINETLARRAFGGSDPIGQVLTMTFGGVPTPFEIVGVAADTRNAGLRAPVEPELVIPMYQQTWPAGGVALMVDSAIAPQSLMGALEEAVWRVDAEQAIARRFTFVDDLDAQLSPARFFAAASGWFAVLALLIGAAGITAVVAAIQRRRTREIGLRLALGAAPHQSAALVLGNAARIVAVGLVIGTLLAVPALGWLQGQLFGVDNVVFWGIFGLTALVLTATALAAAGWPAWRAARVHPMDVLRYE